MSRPGVAVITVQFKVGVPRTEALVRLYDTVNSNADWLPKGLGVLDPIVKPKGIDDVPIVTLTLFSKNPSAGPFDLERVAHSVEADLKRVPGTREVTSLGGPGRAVMVELDPARLSGVGVTVPDLRQALLSALSPRARILPHRGAPGIVRVHLGLMAEPGRAGWRVAGESRPCVEGQVVVEPKPIDLPRLDGGPTTRQCLE